jgi:formylmethanofuran dehydrogenase subunit C
MSTIVLRLEQAPDLRVDLRDVDAAMLASMPPLDAAHVRAWHGNAPVELGAFFRVEASSIDAGAPELRFEGDLSRFDGIGWKLAQGRIVVDGSAGDYVGAAMAGGDIVVHGDAGVFAGCAMAGGRLTVDGDVGDFGLAAFPGDMEGVRGGVVFVGGSAGARFGDRMRRGTAVVAGNAGAFAGSRMVAGTIAIGGQAAPHAGFGMRRGTIVFAGAPPAPDVTFVEPCAEAGVFWRLLARELARFGEPFSALAGRDPRRYVGDLAVGGKGELIVAA